MTEPLMKVADVAAQVRCRPETVLLWIAAGMLRAINVVSPGRTRRPR